MDIETVQQGISHINEERDGKSQEPYVIRSVTVSYYSGAGQGERTEEGQAWYLSSSLEITIHPFNTCL